VLTVPLAAISERGQLQSVFIAEGGVARIRLITTGQKFQDRCEVLSGVTANERVIVPVPVGLADGAGIEVRP
jgi:multidrug efflux pump subunit AcrA (membrane-fusion protein)